MEVIKSICKLMIIRPSGTEEKILDIKKNLNNNL